MSALRARRLAVRLKQAPRVEGWKQKNIFETYLLMGPSRTLPALAQNVNVSYETLQNWSKAFKWTDRLAKRDNKAMMCIEAENDKLYKDVIKSRQQQAYQALQEKSLDFIEKSTRADFAVGKSPMRDAAIALDIGIAGERKVLGLSDSKVRGAFVKDGFAAVVEAIMPEK